jgi:branched-subunit amino acid aminotransferase/4-amino-4-deoxychorismate lyase
MQPHIEVNGEVPTTAALRALTLSGYGHFTAIQVRDRRARGLDLHLARLDQANRELFGVALDGGQVRDYIRHALSASTTADASVRVIVEQPAADEPPWVMVTIRPPAAPPAGPITMQSAPYQRSVAHIKHSKDFGQGYYDRLARRNGYDQALLTGPDGLISEGAITNIGFFDGTTVVWPAAPMLLGTTMQVVQERLGYPQRHQAVRLADLGAFSTVFVTNSHGVAAVSRVDGRELPVDAEFIKLVTESYESAPADQI